MGHQSQRPAQQRLHGVRRVVALDVGVTCHGADANPALRRPHVGQLMHPVDIHEMPRRSEPHVEHRDEALSSGEDLAVGSDVGEPLQGLVERRRGGIDER